MSKLKLKQIKGPGTSYGNNFLLLGSNGSDITYSELSTVAKSGSYTDLTNKPSIPSKTTDLSDVSETSLRNNEVLRYISSASKWENSPQNISTVYIATSNITVDYTYDTIIVRKTTGSATIITLDNGTAMPNGFTLRIKDGKGDAATNNITIATSNSQLIDGASTFIMKRNYQSTTIIWDGTYWNIV